jgi:hypothetical protein
MYRLHNNDNEIKITMSSGKGQATVSSIYLNHQLIEGNIEGGFRNYPIGKSSVLKSSVLALDITVQDVNPDTNATLINLALIGGKEDIVKKYAEIIDSDWGQIHYHISFHLKA